MKRGKSDTASGDPGLTRRGFLQATSAAATAAVLGSSGVSAAGRVTRRRRPNFLFILCDQLRYDALSGTGCAFVRTPNLDRLKARSVSFTLSYSTNPVCTPARASIMTGRMPSETGSIDNNRGIGPGIPHIGEWLGDSGYRTFYIGKWHLPWVYDQAIPGFVSLPAGVSEGDQLDEVVAGTGEAFLHSYAEREPFCLFTGFVQPHDIAFWSYPAVGLVPRQVPSEVGEPGLPLLEPNHGIHPTVPKKVGDRVVKEFSETQWRYYNYIYYRQVEMLDADVGRLLDALEDSGHMRDTVVVFTSDHGESGGRHGQVQKWTPFEESLRVPLFISWPGHIQEGVDDTEHLVCGLDFVPTLCDFAQVTPPPVKQARSLRRLLEGTPTPWRDYLVAEVQITGRVVRTRDFKYVHYDEDPVELLFSLKDDPWELENLADDGRYAEVKRKHESLLRDWTGQLEVRPPTPMPWE